MKEIYEAYRTKIDEEKAQTDAINEKINAKKQKVERLEKSIQKLREQRERIPSTGWVRGVVIPLAEKLAAATGLEYEIYGPFGLSAETSIYLVKDKKVSITTQATKRLTLTPYFDDEHRLQLNYWTGESTDEYRRGSLGELNGFNHVYKPLPETFEEILPLLRSTEKLL